MTDSKKVKPSAAEVYRQKLIDAVETAISVGPMDPVHSEDRHAWGGTWRMEPPPESREDHMIHQGRRACARRAVDAVLAAQASRLAPTDEDILGTFGIYQGGLPNAEAKRVLSAVRRILERFAVQAQDDEVAAMRKVMENVDPASWPGLTAVQRCALGRYAKPSTAAHPQPCGSFEYKAAQADGVLCADDECDRESGVRSAAQARSSGQAAPSDKDILSLNEGEIYFSESPSKYPEINGTQYHAGAPGILGFARALLSRYGQAPAASAEPAWAQEIIDDLQSQFDSEMITENDSGEALIRLDNAIAAIEDAAKRYTPVAAQAPQDDDETEGLRAHIALLKASLAQCERELDELRVATQAPAVPEGHILTEREALADLVVREACETEPADPDDPETIMIRRSDLRWATLAAMLASAPTPPAATAAPSDEELLDTYREACEHAERCNQGHSYGRAQALRAVLQRYGQAPAVSAEPVMRVRVIHKDGEVMDPVIGWTSAAFDRLPHGTELDLFAAPVAAPVADQAQSWAPAGPLQIECDPERFGKAPWHITDGFHHSVGATPNEALNGFARYLASQAPAAPAPSKPWPMEEQPDGSVTFVDPVDIAQTPAAPSPRGDAEFELWQDDMVMASSSGLRETALAEIQHYATVYGQDGPVEVYEVTRTRIDAARSTLVGEGVKK